MPPTTTNLCSVRTDSASHCKICRTAIFDAMRDALRQIVRVQFVESRRALREIFHAVVLMSSSHSGLDSTLPCQR